MSDIQDAVMPPYSAPDRWTLYVIDAMIQEHQEMVDEQAAIIRLLVPGSSERKRRAYEVGIYRGRWNMLRELRARLTETTTREVTPTPQGEAWATLESESAARKSLQRVARKD